MRFVHRGRLCSVILVFLFLSSGLAQDESRTRSTAAAPAVQDLANALALLKTDDERSALLTAEKELVTERLVRELIRQGSGLSSQRSYPEALARFRVAQQITEQIAERTISGIRFTGLASW